MYFIHNIFLKSINRIDIEVLCNMNFIFKTETRMRMWDLNLFIQLLIA